MTSKAFFLNQKLSFKCQRFDSKVCTWCQNRTELTLTVFLYFYRAEPFTPLSVTFSNRKPHQRKVQLDDGLSCGFILYHFVTDNKNLWIGVKKQNVFRKISSLYFSSSNFFFWETFFVFCVVVFFRYLTNSEQNRGFLRSISLDF